MAATTVPPGKRNAALKDRQLVYRACTLGYARSLHLGIPKQLVGHTDSNFLSEQGADLVRQSEERILSTGIPEMTNGAALSPQWQGLFLLRTPVMDAMEVITGVEVNVITAAELHESFRQLVTRQDQYRSLLNQVPFGLLVHQNFIPVYQNTVWSQMTNVTSRPGGSEELEFLLQTAGQTGAGSDSRTDTETASRSSPDYCAIEVDGRLLNFYSRALLWNGQTATSVVCVDADALADGSATANSVVTGFVEKRLGARRDLSATGGQYPESQIKDETAQATLFNALQHPVFVCSNWIPLYANAAADYFLTERSLILKSDNGQDQYQSIESWFSEREKADIETLIRQRGMIDSAASFSIKFESQRYLASVSSTVWQGRSAILVSMQIETARQRELDELSGQLGKLKDFAQSAGDFFWEMDAEQRLTHVSANLQPVLGIRNSEVLGVPLEQVIERHVQPADMAQWSGLAVDLRSQVPFRDRDLKWQNQDGSKRVVRLSGVPVIDETEKLLGYRGIGRDYTAAFNSASAVAYHASHDSLTGLVNRREFENRCDEAIESARTNPHTHALCFMDLDNFKTVNDTCGHLAGDELLRQLSTLFSGLVRKSDVLARLGGDEFGVLVFDVGLNEAMRLADQLRAEVESFQFLWEDNRFVVGVSIGIVLIDDYWESRSALFGAADEVCYEAKNQGRNRVAVYKQTGADTQSSIGANHWVDSIESAIDEKRIRLCMQKILTLDSWDKKATNVELLMRMVSPEGEIVSPSAFLPTADRYGLSVKLDRVVVELAIDWLESQPHVTESMELCAINLNGRSFADEEFTRFLLDALKTASFDVSILCFEITETAAIANLSAVTLFMKRVGELGCQFALDDFGSGLSSFAYLKDLPIKYLKIDGLFVKDILEDSIDFAMVKAINEVGQTLGKKTIAEFVENDEVLNKLRDMGVNYAQGYHIGRPEIIDF